MEASHLPEAIRQKKSYLCVGLDPDPEKLPPHLPKNAEGLVAFCSEIIAHTAPYAVSYKLNSAFFEVFGEEGWKAMRHIFHQLASMEVFAIADAKRADIGNTSRMYAQAFFKDLQADAITLSPYMGSDSIAPFLSYPGKTAILLALTSNPGHQDFEMQKLENGRFLYEEVMLRSLSWERKGDLMFVVGATRTSQLENIRRICPDQFLLVPGVGAQGGDLAETSRLGINQDVGLLINSSRGILYAGNGLDFGKMAGEAAKALQQEMEPWIR
jgi:orotidine-5'-phosphate decarboxylase